MQHRLPRTYPVLTTQSEFCYTVVNRKIFYQLEKAPRFVKLFYKILSPRMKRNHLVVFIDQQFSGKYAGFLTEQQII